MFFLDRRKMEMVSPDHALPGRPDPLPTAETHFVSGLPLKSPVPAGMEEAMFGMGCFWGVERIFWQVPGVWLTMVGYAAGYTPNPTYKETCTQLTGHNEVVRVIFDPAVISYEELLKVFWENHDPTQGNRQGNDVGTQYRSGIYYSGPEQATVAQAVIDEMTQSGVYNRPVVTEVVPLTNYSAAEDYHQDFFARNPNQGYCMAVAAPKVAKFRKTFARLIKP